MNEEEKEAIRKTQLDLLKISKTGKGVAKTHIYLKHGLVRCINKKVVSPLGEEDTIIDRIVLTQKGEIILGLTI